MYRHQVLGLRQQCRCPQVCKPGALFSMSWYDDYVLVMTQSVPPSEQCISRISII